MTREEGVTRWWSYEGERTRCGLCPHHCLLGDGETGICGARKNQEGRMISLSYGEVCASAIDPIERKPMFHYRPGSMLLSLGTFGCNFNCDNCQNSVLARGRKGRVPTESTTPGMVVSQAVDNEVDGIAWTFNEPIVWLEFILDTAVIAREQGLFTMMNTNGFISPDALDDAIPLVDAMNIDVKGFSEEFYISNCGGHLEDVLLTCASVREAGVHVELTYLLIPGMNDSDRELGSFFEWVVGEMGENTPLHLYRFYPSFRLSHLPEQSMETMGRVYRMARDAGIRYPYLAGVLEDDRQNTYCPECGELLISRRSEEPPKMIVSSTEVSRFCPTYPRIDVRFDKRRCPNCGCVIPMVP